MPPLSLPMALLISRPSFSRYGLISKRFLGGSSSCFSLLVTGYCVIVKDAAFWDFPVNFNFASDFTSETGSFLYSVKNLEAPFPLLFELNP